MREVFKRVWGRMEVENLTEGSALGEHGLWIARMESGWQGHSNSSRVGAFWRLFFAVARKES